MQRNKRLAKIVKSREGLNLVSDDTSNVRMNLIYTTLKNRGIENRSNFINPVEYKQTPVRNIANIDNILPLEKAIKDGKSVGVLVDVDCDGMTSGAMFINYFQDNYKNTNLHPIFPKAKLHGIKANYDTIMEYNDEYNFAYIVSPDSSSNDIMAMKQLEKHGIKVVVIDHHDFGQNTVTHNPEEVINNQSPFNDDDVDKNFTGAGMVFEVLSYLDKHNGTDYATGYLDLFALGQIADISDISDLEVRALMLRGFKAINNPLIIRLVQTRRLQLSPKALQFSIIPLINSVMRVGSVEDKNVLFKALIKDDSGDYQIKKRRNVNHHFVYEDIVVDIYDYVIKMMEGIKADQKKKINAALKTAEYFSSDSDNFNLVKIDNQGAGITGLIANQLLGDTGKASFVVYPNTQGTYNGSMRIPMAYTDTLEQLHTHFSDLGNLVFAQGHENAAGIGFDLSEKYIQPTKDILNDMFIPVKNTYKVDDYYINDTPDLSVVKMVHDMGYCFGGSVSEPVVGILGLELKVSNLVVKKTTLHIKKNGLEFIKFNLKPDELETIETMQQTLDDTYNLYVDFVGTLGMNTFLGRTTHQFVIDDMEFSTKIEDDDNKDRLIF